MSAVTGADAVLAIESSVWGLRGYTFLPGMRLVLAGLVATLVSVLALYTCRPPPDTYVVTTTHSRHSLPVPGVCSAEPVDAWDAVLAGAPVPCTGEGLVGSDVPGTPTVGVALPTVGIRRPVDATTAACGVRESSVFAAHAWRGGAGPPTVVFTTLACTDTAYCAAWLRSWYEGFRANMPDVLPLVVATDARSRATIMRLGVDAYLHFLPWTGPARDRYDPGSLGAPENVKHLYAAAAVRCGYAVLFSDIDVVIPRGAPHALRAYYARRTGDYPVDYTCLFDTAEFWGNAAWPATLEFQRRRDAGDFRGGIAYPPAAGRCSTGLWVAWPRPRMLAALELFIARQEDPATFEWEQAHWNRVLGLSDVRSEYFSIFAEACNTPLLDHLGLESCGPFVHVGFVHGDAKFAALAKHHLYAPPTELTHAALEPFGNPRL